MSFPKQNCPLLKCSCCSDVSAGRGWGKNLKTKGKLWRVGRPQAGSFSPHTSKPLNARRSRSRAGSCLLLSQQLQGPQHQGVCPKQVNTICPVLTRCPSSCLLLPAGRVDLGRYSQPPHPFWMALQLSVRFSSLSQGPQTQPLPDIYHRGRALFKNTQSPFVEISKGTESMRFLFEGEALS